MRKIIDLNTSWKYTKDGVTSEVALPHNPAATGAEKYRPGVCFYERYLEAIPEGRVRVEFDAVNSVSETQINCVKLGMHRGGFTRFGYDITESIRHDCVLGITVYDSDFEDVCAGRGLMRTGMHGGARLIVTGECRFSTGDYSSDGLYVTPFRSGDEWYLGIKALIDSPASGAKLVYKLKYPSGKVYRSKECGIGETETYINCGKPHLWQGVKDPYLYSLTAEIILADGTVSDNLTVKTGFREFRADEKEGAFLCGEKIKIRGIDFAASDGDFESELSALIEGGINAVKPEPGIVSGSFLDLCDEKGILVFAQTSFAGELSPRKQANAVQQLLEIIKQCYNHPSVICFGIGGEIEEGEKPGDACAALAELNGIAKSVDSTRYTFCTQRSGLAVSSSLNSITDLVCYRLPAAAKDAEDWLEKWRSFNPEKKLAVMCEAENAGAPETKEWLWGSFICTDIEFEKADAECFGLSDKLGDVLAGDEAKNLIRAGFGSRLEVLFSPLAKPISGVKTGTALRLLRRAGMSDDTATKLEGYLKSIKK